MSGPRAARETWRCGGAVILRVRDGRARRPRFGVEVEHSSRTMASEQARSQRDAHDPIGARQRVACRRPPPTFGNVAEQTRRSRSTLVTAHALGRGRHWRSWWLRRLEVSKRVRDALRVPRVVEVRCGSGDPSGSSLACRPPGRAEPAPSRRCTVGRSRAAAVFRRQTRSGSGSHGGEEGTMRAVQVCWLRLTDAAPTGDAGRRSHRPLSGGPPAVGAGW